jgi:hypothetical protein
LDPFVEAGQVTDFAAVGCGGAEEPNSDQYRVGMKGKVAEKMDNSRWRSRGIKWGWEESNGSGKGRDVPLQQI